jgi:hypothetical protein
MVSASKFTAAYRAMCRAGYQAVLPKAAAWTSRKLSAAIVLGLALLALLPEMPPFLAAAPAAPVEMVRTVRVPYLDPAPPGDAASPRPSGRAGGSGEKAAASVSAAPDGKGNAKKGDAEKGDAGKADPKADSKAAAPADARPAQSADPKAASKAEPPEPEGWSDPEVVAALRECLRRLAPLGRSAAGRRRLSC